MNSPRHIISAHSWTDKNQLEHFFHRAEQLEDFDKTNNLPHSLTGKILACLFYEPSTRTRFSFEAAMQKLGGGIITAEDASARSSSAKGETLADAIRIISGYCDAIVLRHFEKGAAERAAEVSPVPVINAGDGAGEHPTQALLDLYTIKRELKEIDGVAIALIGDLLYGRTIHSLLPLLAQYRGVKLHLISPPELRLPEEYKMFLKQKGVWFQESEQLNTAIPYADVLYATRIQKERLKNVGEYEKVKNAYVIDQGVLKRMKRDGIIMHPLPRVNEIAPEVDSDIRAVYFRQAKNGLYIRMALLEHVLNNQL